MSELQDKLEQLEKEIACHRNAQGTLDGCITAKRKQIEGIKKQIADAEVTYSIGDRFKHGSAKRMLVDIAGEICMISLDYGSKANTIGKVGDRIRITKEEFGRLGTICNYTRYWDNRKQEEC